MEIILDKVARDFDGEDPLRPYLREALNESKATLERVRLLLEYKDGRPLPELREPDAEQLDELR